MFYRNYEYCKSHGNPGVTGTNADSLEELHAKMAAMQKPAVFWLRKVSPPGEWVRVLEHNELAVKRHIDLLMKNPKGKK